jgi:SAM-dependent methyltransferase
LLFYRAACHVEEHPLKVVDQRRSSVRQVAKTTSNSAFAEMINTTVANRSRAFSPESMQTPIGAPKALLQPTDPHIIWGRRSDRLDRRFQARANIVEYLISRWTAPDWCGVDVSGGAGRWLTTLAPHFRHFTHLDLSPEALHVARNDHPDLPHVEYAIVDLLKPTEQGSQSARTWDAVFCFDTLLYRGEFVENVLRNIRAFISPRGIAIIDVPMQFRASISQRVKGQRYPGPERKFSPKAALAIARELGYTCLGTAYHYSELSAPSHRTLIQRRLTEWIPWPSTWMYLVLRVTDQP